MTIVFNENFEGVGYQDANWVEFVAGGNSVNEDADTAEAGSPFKWADNCLSIDVVDIAQHAATQNISMGALPISYTRFEFVLGAHSITNGMISKIFSLENGVTQVANFLLFSANGIITMLTDLRHDGGANFLPSPEIVVGVKYRVELKWDATNDEWELRLNGMVLGRSVLTATHETAISSIIVGSAASNSNGPYIAYIDNITIDNATWVGSDGLAAAPSVRSDIVSAIVNQLKTITTSNGYNTELASNVINWQLTNVSVDSLPGVEVKDITEESERRGTLNYRKLNIEIVGRVASSDISDSRNLVADITAAMAAGPAYPANVYLATLIDNPEFLPEEKDRKVTKITMAYEIEYRE